jgi:hypothetical protein
MIIHHVGKAESFKAAGEMVREALDSGRAAGRVK